MSVRSDLQLTRILERPVSRALAFVLCLGMFYAPKYFVGQVPAVRVSIVLGVLLFVGALVVYKLPRLAWIQDRLSRYSLGLILLFATLMFISTAMYSAFQYQRFVPLYDSAEFAQALWLVLEGTGLRHIFGDPSPSLFHVTPTLLLMLPFYYLFPSVLSLLVIRSALLAAAAILLYLVARMYLTKDMALFIAIAYLLNFTIVYQMTSEFHVMQLFPFVFFLACLYFERRNYVGWIVTMTLIAGIREEMGFVVLGFAALAYLRSMPRKYWIGGLCLGLVWLMFSYEFIFETSAGKYPFRSNIIGTSAGADLSPFWRWQNGLYLYHITLPFLFILPFWGWSFLPVLPIFFGILYVEHQAHTPYLHYSLPVVAGFYYAMSRNVSGLVSRLGSPRGDVLAVVLGVALVSLGLTHTFDRILDEKSLHPPIGGAFGLIVAEGSNIGRDTRAFTEWIESLGEATRLIPAGCRAAVPTHVTARAHYQYGPLNWAYDVESSPEYVLVDENIVQKHLSEPKERLLNEILGARYRSIYHHRGVVLYSLKNEGNVPSGLRCRKLDSRHDRSNSRGSTA